MIAAIESKILCEFGLTHDRAYALTQIIPGILAKLPPEQAWHKISKQILTKEDPFQLHHYLFSTIFPDWPTHPELAPAWLPDATTIAKAHLTHLMQELNLNTREEFHRWSVTHFQPFWKLMLNKLGIIFQHEPTKICDLKGGVEHPQWLLDAKLNIAESCFKAAPNKIAIIQRNEHDGKTKKMTYGELKQLSNRISHSIIKIGIKPGDKIAIDMAMTTEAIAIYLGIIKIGAVVVSIADSFTADEIATRLRIANANAVFTQESIIKNGKKLPLYEKVVAANAPTTIVLPDEHSRLILRNNDRLWDQFLVANDQEIFNGCDPLSPINILFSSGTTSDPKAIPWNHTTPIKVATDAYLHQDIHPEDILAWPTNLGWMMGPWLLFAAFINQATLALYNGSPGKRQFGEFVQDAKVTLLGVVPTLVATWRHSHCMAEFNWQTIKLFTSTGECSNPEDMFYLMHLAGYKPIIEYCGGTEIGGAYISSTIIEKNYPSLFTTPAMGIDFLLIDEQGKPSHNGEVALVPPSIGLSTELLNADQHKIYYAHMPKSPDGKIMRRHGDQIKKFSNNLYCILGRTDDTMNLGAIKISSAEIERVLVGIVNITETAAIAVSSPQQGPSLLVIYAVTMSNLEEELVKKEMQKRINQHLNPLFKIHEVIFVRELPKTASNKIMRRVLRSYYKLS
jgi:acetyl-CoA synthetase